jgi:hypothetical protein
MDEIEGKVWYHLSAVPRNSLQDWLMIFTHWRGKKYQIGGKEYTLRVGGSLKRVAQNVREHKIKALEMAVRVNPEKGHCIYEGYLSEQDIDYHLQA